MLIFVHRKPKAPTPKPLATEDVLIHNFRGFLTDDTVPVARKIQSFIHTR